jgi:adenylosuccinate lyase
MAELIDQSGGAAMTENLMLALTAKGLARGEAHELLRRLSAAGSAASDLSSRARSDPTITKHLSPTEIEEALSPESYVRAAAEKTDRVVGQLERELGR